MSVTIFDWVKSEENEQQNDRTSNKEKIKFESKEGSNNRRKQKRKHSEHDTESNSSGGSGKPKRALEIEMDSSVLQRRQKQIDYGKNTVGYHNYLSQVPIAQRTQDHPKTPDKYSKYSRRSWDMLIKIWRKKLHEYDVDAASNDDDNQDSNEDSEK